MSCAKPNILFIFPDQLSARWLGCYGNPVVHSPNLDHFSEESVFFRNAYTNCPLCTPYRGSLLTGRYPSQTGVTQNGMALPPEEETIASLLNDASYNTYYVGKWHLAGAPQADRWVLPDKRGGFQDFIGWESHHVDHFQGRIWADDPEVPIVMEGHETDALTAIVCDRLENVVEDPFCMFVSYQAPHPPCTPLERHLDLYKGKELFHEPSADLDSWFRISNWGADYDVATFRERYFGEISHLDEVFGKVLSKLDEQGLSDNTVVIFTSDHGEMNGCHGLFQKSVMYDESIRVPLMVRMPHQTDGVSVDYPFSTVDFLPTLLELCSAEPHPEAEGISFAENLQNLDFPDSERTIFVEHHHFCVIRGVYKLVVDRSTPNSNALFNLQSDPYEMTNLVAEPSHKDKVSQLLSELQRFQTQLRGASAKIVETQ